MSSFRLNPLLAACLALALPPGIEAAPFAFTCAQCHAKQAAEQPGTGMARALQGAAQGVILAAHPKLTFQQGKYSYAITREGNGSFYTVGDGKTVLRFPIAWAFGLGVAGQTYLIEREGAWYESRVSYYKDIDGLDLTTGARRQVPEDIEEAFGRRQSGKGAEECFNCHATGALPGGHLDTSALASGVQCARCHAGADAHQAGFQSPGAAKTIPARLSAMSTEEMSDFCGQCHRTWAQIAVSGPRSVANVRFQPYRLTNSRCYDAEDRRIRCTACHDPHREVVGATAFYDSKCLACHAAGGKPGAKPCPVAKRDCVTCHMPKTALTEAHTQFTDHYVRVVHPGDRYPD